MRLILGDATQVVRNLPSDSIDMVFLDPPYPVISGGNKNPSAPKGILSANDGKIFEHNSVKFEQYLPDLFRVMRESTHLYLMTNFLNLFEARDGLIAAGFDLHNLLVWRKQNCNPNRWYMKNGEYILLAYKGRAKTINDCGSKTIFDAPNPIGTGKTHPTEKPVVMIHSFISNSTLPGETVLDLFMGTGASGVAARKAGRQFIGVEIDPKYMAVAVKRLGVLPT